MFVHLSVSGRFWFFAPAIQSKRYGITCVYDRGRIMEEGGEVKRKQGKRFRRQILFARTAYDAVSPYIRAEDFTVGGRGLGKNFRA